MVDGVFVLSYFDLIDSDLVPTVSSPNKDTMPAAAAAAKNAEAAEELVDYEEEEVAEAEAAKGKVRGLMG